MGDALGQEGRLPDAVFKVNVPNDTAFNEAAGFVRSTKNWDWMPDKSSETNCVVGANLALRSGGAAGVLLQPILPRDLYNALSENDYRGTVGVVRLSGVPW